MEIIYTDKDGNTTKFTEEMAIVAITERDNLRTQLSDCQVTFGCTLWKNCGHKR
jgi:hypothetical protein